jgi:hypothetical protein
MTGRKERKKEEEKEEKKKNEKRPLMFSGVHLPRIPDIDCSLLLTHV